MNHPPATTTFDPAERVLLGRKGPRVTRLALGTNPVSGLRDQVSYADAAAVVQAAWDAGVRFFDVAPLYGFGFAERIVGEVLRQYPRDSYVITTKVGRLIKDSGPPEREDRTILYQGQQRYKTSGPERVYFDFSYDGVMRSVEESQERTGIERFEMLFTHDPEEFMTEAADGAYRALDELRSSGQTDAIGIGANLCATHLELLRHGQYDVILLAGRYTLLDQSALTELLPLCEQRDIAVLPGGVYNSGILAHPDPASMANIDRSPEAMATWKGNTTFNYDPAGPEVIDRAAAIKAVCDRHAVPLKTAALHFPLHHPTVASVCVGARTPSQAMANDEALRLPVPDDLWQELKHERLLPKDAPTP